jgi:erythromycin esterase-like protein
VAVVDSQLQCLEPYRNRGATPGRSRTEYATLSVSIKAACAAGLADVQRRTVLLNAQAPGYAAAVHHARLIQQFEAMATELVPLASNRARDAAMAENVAWLHEQAGETGGVIVWAHNDHVTRESGAMGAHLHTRYGPAYRPLGFAYGTGSFYAVLLDNGQLKDVRVHASNQVRSGSVEEAFLGVDAPLLLLDMRRTLAGEPGADALRRPMLMRNIGSAFDPRNELAFHATRLFPADFDLLLFVRSGSPATSLLIP